MSQFEKYQEDAYNTTDDTATITMIVYYKASEHTKTHNPGYRVVQNMERDSEDYCTLYMGERHNTTPGDGDVVPYLVLSQAAIDLIAQFATTTKK